MTVQGALAGLLVGEAIVVPLALSGHDPFLGVNAGLLGLVANVVVNVVVSRGTHRDGEPAAGGRFERQTEAVSSSST
jgi:hypothetical protein